MPRSLVLLSGGLDSTLVVRLLLDMGVEVEAVHFSSPFCRCTPESWGCSAAHRAAEQAGITVHSVACGKEYLEVVKQPRFGRGSQMNPCLDCRVFMFTRARELMAELGTDFIATGEVLGQRPMSQRRNTMQLIEKESGLDGLIVRPLSAQLLPPSVPEQKGWVDRNQLLAISGRSRKPQMALAKERDIRDYPCPAGGCLLNDPEFAVRFKDLLDHEPSFGVAEARLLKWGRHFRLPSGRKAVVGRNEQENGVIEAAARAGSIVLRPVDVPAPSALLPAGGSADDVTQTAGLMAAYSKSTGGFAVQVAEKKEDSVSEWMVNVVPFSRDLAVRWRIGREQGTPSDVEKPSGEKEV
jgi:tRNA-uridine 2-sulfurtransferase